MAKVYILHHTNQGTPEANEIESVHGTMAEAKAHMKKVLHEDYEVTPAENEEEDYMYMSITTHQVKSKK